MKRSFGSIASLTIGVGLIAFFSAIAGWQGLVLGLVFGLPWVFVARNYRQGIVAGQTAQSQEPGADPFKHLLSPSQSWNQGNIHNTTMSPAYQHLPHNIHHR